MNDFDTRITAAFAALPPADVYLKNRLLHLPEEEKKPAPRRALARRLIPMAAALAVIAVVGTAVLWGGSKTGMLHEAGPPAAHEDPTQPSELPPIPFGSILGEGAMGFEAHMNKSAAELHRASLAYGRESELGTMGVYRNPNFAKQLSEPEAMEIAKKFGQALGKTYVYTPPHWLDDPELQRARQEKLELLPPEERERIENAPLGYWEFQCGSETLTVNSAHGVVTLTGPLPASLPKGDGTTARYEAMCLQIYTPYTDAIAALTGLRFNKASTVLEYNIYGEKIFTTFLYANNPGDSLAKQAEDYALKRLDVTVLEEMEYDEERGYQEAKFYLNFDLQYPGPAELLGYYPVLDLEGAKRELLAGRYEASVDATKEELARATIEEAELIYSIRPWLSAWMPVYRLCLTFPPEDMEDWNNNNPELNTMGLRNFYVFYVPAVPSRYLVPQQEDGSMPRPVY